MTPLELFIKSYVKNMMESPAGKKEWSSEEKAIESLGGKAELEKIFLFFLSLPTEGQKKIYGFTFGELVTAAALSGCDEEEIKEDEK